MRKRATGNNGPEPGDSFETTAVLTGDHLSKFGINPKFVEMYGMDKLHPVLDVRCTIKEKDLSVKEIYNIAGYDPNSVDYLGFFEIGKEVERCIIMPNIKLFNTCFPAGADAECFGHDGNRTGTICRLDVEIVGKHPINTEPRVVKK